jgi:hypothetical protein
MRNLQNQINLLLKYVTTDCGLESKKRTITHYTHM